MGEGMGEKEGKGGKGEKGEKGAKGLGLFYKMQTLDLRFQNAFPLIHGLEP